jgi:CHAD domain-containing protein
VKAPDLPERATHIPEASVVAACPLMELGGPEGPLVVPVDPWLEVPRRVLGLVSDVRAACEQLLATSDAPPSQRAPSEPTSEAEAIHDFRVALRRLRSVLKPLRSTSGRRAMRNLGDRLRSIAANTGELRDEEVLRETLADLELDDGVRRSLDRWMRGRRRRESGLRSRVLRALRAEHEARANDGLEATLELLSTKLSAPPKRLVGDSAFARRSLVEAYAAVLQRAAGAHAAGSDALHQLRIGLKRLRYSAEVFGDRCAIDARTIEKRAAKLQKLLGHVHDLEEAKRRMTRAWGLEAPARAAVLAALASALAATFKRCARDVPRELVGIHAAIQPLL